MAGSGQHDDSGARQPLHVLLVDDDTAELRRTAVRLLEAGYVVSARCGAAGLFETIAGLQPQLVLLDPLLVDLDFAKLSRYSRVPDGPRVVLHSRVLPRVLHGAISFKDVLGVIHKTDDDQEFVETFDELARIVARQMRPLAPAVSGTHLIGAVHALPFERRARRS